MGETGALGLQETRWNGKEIEEKKGSKKQEKGRDRQHAVLSDCGKDNEPVCDAQA